MSTQTMMIGSVRVPSILYGTAWKEEQSQRLTELALQTGFRGIDTANQRRHYFEAAVGQAITASIKSGLVSRAELFLQTKFTFRRGQDHRLPYDPDASISTQVEQSFTSSLSHLNTEVIDAYLLHGPSRRDGLAKVDWEAWQAMETIHDSGRARLLGISNVTLEQLQILCKQARVQPAFVQNRCYAVEGWDRKIRRFCQSNGMVYQGFSLLTANSNIMSHPEMAKMAMDHHCSVSQLVFRFAQEVGMVALTGTTDLRHMQDDLAAYDLRLTSGEVAKIETLVAR